MPAVAEWFLKERSITPETLTHFNVSVRTDGAVVLPYTNGEKVRKGIPHGEREFFFTAGQKPDLFNSQDANKPVCFLVEGETDTMRLWQEAGADGVGVLGLSGIESWRDEMSSAFLQTDRVFVILDNDKDYNVVGRVDNAYREIRASLRGKAQRIRLPRDVKDVCEFFDTYDLDTLRLLTQHKGISESRFKLLDLTAEPPPVRWLVEGLMCRGDVHLLMGDPNLGKSWLTMDLALSIAQGRGDWIGQKVLEQGRVLYIDEENPEDLVYDRLIKLGMTTEDAKNIRYINNENIRLDRNVDELIEEALEFEPTLIVIDAMRRIHTGDENSAGEMNKLFNDSIKPLARETGAAVIMIHHANKGDSNSSFKRTAGSGDIGAGVDWGFDVRGVGICQLSMAVYKSRRKPVGDVINVTIKDTEDGVRLVGGLAPEVLF
jgi:hypothetical protein